MIYIIWQREPNTGNRLFEGAWHDRTAALHHYFSLLPLLKGALTLEAYDEGASVGNVVASRGVVVTA